QGLRSADHALRRSGSAGQGEVDAMARRGRAMRQQTGGAKIARRCPPNEVGTMARALRSQVLVLAFVLALCESACAQGASNLSNSSIEFAYFPPKSEKFQGTLDRLKSHQVLEQLSQFLSPLRLPHKFYL